MAGSFHSDHLINVEKRPSHREAGTIIRRGEGKLGRQDRGANQGEGESSPPTGDKMRAWGREEKCLWPLGEEAAELKPEPQDLGCFRFSPISFIRRAGHNLERARNVHKSSASSFQSTVKSEHVPEQWGRGMIYLTTQHSPNVNPRLPGSPRGDLPRNRHPDHHSPPPLSKWLLFGVDIRPFCPSLDPNTS